MVCFLVTIILKNNFCGRFLEIFLEKSKKKNIIWGKKSIKKADNLGALYMLYKILTALVFSCPGCMPNLPPLEHRLNNKKS